MRASCSGLGRSWGGLGLVLDGVGVVLGRLWSVLWRLGAHLHLDSFLELILSHRPGRLMKGFFITLGLSRGGSGGYRRGATWQAWRTQRGSKVTIRGPRPP